MKKMKIAARGRREEEADLWNISFTSVQAPSREEKERGKVINYWREEEGRKSAAHIFLVIISGKKGRSWSFLGPKKNPLTSCVCVRCMTSFFSPSDWEP